MQLTTKTTTKTLQPERTKIVDSKKNPQKAHFIFHVLISFCKCFKQLSLDVVTDDWYTNHSCDLRSSFCHLLCVFEINIYI